MSCFACASVSLRGSVSCAVICRYLSSCLIVASSATAIAEHVAPFVADADLEHRHAIRRLVERIEVAGDVLVVGHVPRLAGDVAEELQRRRHLVGGRHVIDQLGQDARVGRGRLDLGGVVGVELLRTARQASTARRCPVEPTPAVARAIAVAHASRSAATPAYRSTHSNPPGGSTVLQEVRGDARTARKISRIEGLSGRQVEAR